MTVYTGLWIYFSFFSLMSLIVVVSGIYEERFASFGLSNKVSLLPYVYNYITVFLLLLPFKTMKSGTVFIQEKISIVKSKKLLNIILVFLIFYTIFKFLIYLRYANYSVLDRREISISGTGFIQRQGNAIIWYIDYISGIVYSIVYPFVILCVLKLYFLRALTLKRLFTMILFCIMAPTISFFMASNRSAIFFIFVNLLFFIFLFTHVFSVVTKRKFYKLILIVSVPMVLGGMLISQERYKDNEEISMEHGILSYMGESFPNLGTVVYGQVSRHSYGMIFFSDYLHFFSENVPVIKDGLIGFYEFWTAYTGVTMLVFKTLYGDLYIEFGELGAILFMVILSFLVCMFAKHTKRISFLHYSVFYIYFTFATNAVFDFGTAFGRLYTLRVLIGIVLFNLLIRSYIMSANDRE